MKPVYEELIEQISQGGGGGSGLSSVPIGAIVPYAGATEPEGFKFANGQAISRTEYTELFAIIGTTYGAGDGSTTFNLPDLRGKAIVSIDDNDNTYFSTLGKILGEKTHTLTTNEMPSHNHTQNAHRHYVNSPTASTYCSKGNTSTDPKSSNSNVTNYTDYQTPTINNTGGGQAHNNIQPSMVTNMIIRVKNDTTVIDTSNIDIEALKQEILNASVVSRNSIMLAQSSIITWNGNSNPVHFIFHTIRSQSGNLLSVPNTGYVQIGPGINHVEVTVDVDVGNTNQSNYLFGFIRRTRGSAVNAFARGICKMIEWNAIHCTAIVPVQEGDLIDFAVSTPYTGQITFPTYDTFAYTTECSLNNMCVRVID